MGFMTPFLWATNVHCQKMNPFCDIKCEMGYRKCCGLIYLPRKEAKCIYMHVFLYPSAIIVEPNIFEANKSGQINSFFFSTIMEN